MSMTMKISSPFRTSVVKIWEKSYDSTQGKPTDQIPVHTAARCRHVPPLTVTDGSVRQNLGTQ